MKYTVKIAMIFIPNYIMIGSGIEKLMGIHRYTHTETARRSLKTTVGM
jgi:hypothetical protein